MRLGLGQAQLLLSPSPSLSLFPSPAFSLRLHLTLPSSPYNTYPFLCLSSSSSSFPATCTTNNNCNYNSNTNHGDHGHGTGGSSNNNNRGGGGWWPWNWEEGGGGGSGSGSGSDDNNNCSNYFLLLCLLFLLPCGSLALALALANAESTVLWEVSRGTRRKVLIGDDGCFVSVTRGSGGDDDKYKQGGMPSYWWRQCRDTVTGLMLPHGYPHSVSADYMEYSLWRGVQGIASQVSGVLSTQVPSFLPFFCYISALQNMCQPNFTLPRCNPIGNTIQFHLVSPWCDCTHKPNSHFIHRTRAAIASHSSISGTGLLTGTGRVGFNFFVSF